MRDDKPTILVIDDDVAVLQVETNMLQEFGYNVISCSRSDVALDIVASHVPLDMVLIDIIIVGSMNGWSLAERIRAARPHLKIAYTSGYLGPTASDQVIVRGERYLPKPWKATALENFVRDALAS
jgi:DNA-binding NtrC family response regulator